MAIPTKDVALVDWSTNTSTRLTAAPATYGTTAAVATSYAAVHTPFLTAYNNLIAARASGPVEARAARRERLRLRGESGS